MGSLGTLETTENEAVIEASFRRLLAAIESERDRIRSKWADINQERSSNAASLELLRQQTDKWCHDERQTIENEWKRLDKLRERMSLLWSGPDPDSLEINCSGTLYALPRNLLVSVEGSYLNSMFSDAFIGNIPKDDDGRFYLDFNPVCFGLIIQYLRERCEPAYSTYAVLPPVPPQQQQNMDVLIEALKLKPFMPINRINPGHGTSLKVSAAGEGRSVIEASHPGWQVISAAFPLSMASNAYFEVQIIANSETRAGLTVGICGHMPQGPDTHTIRLADSIMYNSAIGLIGDAFAAENVTKGLVLSEGSCIGIRHDPRNHRVEWFYNRSSIGSACIKHHSQEKLLQIFPVVALAAKGQKVEMNFIARGPLAKGAPPGDDDD